MTCDCMLIPWLFTPRWVHLHSFIAYYVTGVCGISGVHGVYVIILWALVYYVITIWGIVPVCGAKNEQDKQQCT